MMHRNLILTCLAPAVALAGCAGTKNRGIESVHQPVVGRSDYQLDLGAPGGRLAAGEQQRLTGWLTGLHAGYGDRVAVDDPAGRNPEARDAVSSVVAGFGLLLADETPPSAAPVQPGTVRVVVSRMRADVPHCNDWSRDSSVDYEQNTSSFYGCAVNGNLAAMAANPQDLVHGAGNSRGSDPMIVYKSIDLYRKAAPSGGGGTTVKAESAGGK
ncbi:CpaD family pilus assembly protein [Sphingomonas sp. KR1UV-12]|uniref:CpaD family pilus assembly protein n=1 Tax=Sphingomonas aurea TaxID=3063994 RepID=A0ABT9EGQ2_9SPHN|nr:CpaD family pilus assembly protein [Sphingomonas sp. KR1UV-12]MDP1025793.1 CpaD family pilus assembly protein [Sphingomonas sp. KR1UV-12]